MSAELYDVAIVGYGPGAQCLAALLARAGHRVFACERYPHLHNLPRAGHIDHETFGSSRAWAMPRRSRGRCGRFAATTSGSTPAVSC